ncbi:MAG TPA: oxygen-independent coproporphyrinogen III oxidase [Gammaproteobacteria bacterium]|jgi:oxygen-independent coproporphyrinogen-3 oxidase|nr:oxygen-independent coproporphyrinogen III oxidase [Gammaproteobacteria bacterium]
MENPQPVLFDPELVRRYDRSGPRYTSYPTARQFHAPFDPDHYRDEVARSNDDPIPSDLSLYLHLPFCNSPCFYCGCNRIISRDPDSLARYLQRLLHEAELQGALFDRDRPVRQLHLGGGTPTQFNDDQLRMLWHGLHSHFRFASRVEASIEVDPRGVTPARMGALAELGFTRVSFGIQDLDPEVQEAVNRRQDRQHCLDVIAAAQAAGFESVAVDLIYGLPRQNVQGWNATLDAMIAAKPGRVAVYGYAHMPAQFKAQRQIKDAELPDAAARLELLKAAVDRLTGAGYEHIGMDHFALPEDSLMKARRQGLLQRNFQGYSTLAGLDLVGLGVSAIGHVGRVYAQNAKTLDAYYGPLDQGRLPITAGLVMSDDDLVRADIINRLMCYGELRYADIERRHGVHFPDYFARELRRLEPLGADGLVVMEAEGVRVTPKGRFLLRSVAMQFDAYLPGPETPRFSRVI